jgi:phage terminase small subunit
MTKKKTEPTHAEIVQGLIDRGVRADFAVMYADAFTEYQEAVKNIREKGSIVQHPRTSNPIENPYLVVRDRARAALQKFRLKQAEYLWQTQD